LKFGATVEIDQTVLYTVPMLVTCVPGALAPDIDLSQSSMGRKHAFLSKHLKHRGITHTLLVPVILAFLTYFLLSMGSSTLTTVIFTSLASLVAGYNLGWLSHIAADLFNKKGVPILWPLPVGNIHLACVKTKGFQKSFRDWEEPLFTIIYILGVTIWTYPNLISDTMSFVSQVV